MVAVATDDRRWQTCYRWGAVAALIGVAGALLDIGLTMTPGWGPQTVPDDVGGWFAQLTERPWLGLRNLDLLNAVLVVANVPVAVAIVAAHRRTTPGVSLIGAGFVIVGAGVFVAGSAALPMLQLARQCPDACAGPVSPAVAGAAQALLARGAHASYGALPGFLLCELGTAVLAWSMLRGGVFGSATAWLGLAGVAGLTAYTVAVTLQPEVGALVMALAVPAGVAMIAWLVRVARTLRRLGEGSTS